MPSPNAVVQTTKAGESVSQKRAGLLAISQYHYKSRAFSTGFSQNSIYSLNYTHTFKPKTADHQPLRWMWKLKSQLPPPNTSTLLVYTNPHCGRFCLNLRETKSLNLLYFTNCMQLHQLYPTTSNNFQQLYTGIPYLKKVKEIKRIGLSPVRLTLRSSKCYIISQSHSVKLNPHSHINQISMMLEDLLETPSSISSWQLPSSTVWGALILIETALYVKIEKIQNIFHVLFSSQVSKRCVYLYQVSSFLGNF